MMTEPDRGQVLKLVEAGTIHADEGVRLLKAMGHVPRPPGSYDGWMHVRVSTLSTQHPKITVRLPLAWVSLGLRIGSRFEPDLAGIDMNEVLEAIRSGAEGRILDVENAEDDERIEIFVD